MGNILGEINLKVAYIGEKTIAKLLSPQKSNDSLSSSGLIEV